MATKSTSDLTKEELAEMSFDGSEMQIYVESPRWYGQLWFLLRQIHPARHSYRVATGLKWSEVFSVNDPLTHDISDTFRLDNAATQDLFDQLWKMGYRPSSGTSSEGALEATKLHLQDMQRLVFTNTAKGV